MKKNLLIYSFLSLFFFLTISSNVNAQIKDTTTFDYDAYTGCDACGDKISYLPQSKDSISDVPKSGLYINSIRVKVKLFTCYTGDLYLYINGQKAATSTINSNCSCNACDSISFVLSTADVRAFYKINQKNIIEVKSYNSNDLYLDRVIFIREYEKRYNFDAGILSIDSPSVFVCPGAKNIKVKIYNNGKKQFSALNLDWKWNGVSQTSVSYSSSTLDTFNGSGSNTALVSLGSKTFTKAKQDTLIVWTRNPGGVADSANFNDTMFYVFNGSYGDTITVGGTSPMFSTIQSAIDELMSFGVCSPTYVKIRPGTYNEQLYIGNIPGTSAANTVTFLSSNNDSSSVIINYSANSSDNYTVQLEDVSNIKFHRLTFEALNTSYGRVFYLRRSLENIYFSNCAINGISTTSTSTSRAAIYRENGSNSDKTQNINFNRTQINNGSYGMYFDNPYYTIGNGFYISNCVFNNQYYANLQYQYGQNIGISNSTFIRNSSSYEYGGGVRFNYIDDSLIFANNNVLQNNGGYGFYLYSSYAPDSKRFLIANNFISVNTSLDYSDDNALYLQSVENADVIFNSVYRQTENSNNSALVISDGYNNQLLNNNIYNDNKGKVFRISGSSTTMKKSDRNNFYNNGGDLGNWLNNSISTIDELASIVKMDSNSVSSDPNLMSSTNGHAYNVFLDGGASPFSGITKDLDGENRNATTPDIGADEFRLIGVDAGLVGFVKPKVGTSCASVVLRNYGATTLTSVKIDWKHNGTAKSQVSWTGSLAKGRDTIVCLGNITFAKDTLYKFLAWTSAPNSATDSIPMNDSTYDELYPAMRGEYTIGGTSPDFSTFADAVAAVEKAGVIDSVLFKVRNGTYTEQIEINEIEGASAKNSVIFQSESKDSTKVTLEYYSSSGSNDNYVVYLNRARGITFRKMTLQNGSTDYQTVVKINNGSKNISFENNIIQCEDSISTYYEFSLVLSENNEGKEVDFVRNVFNRGSYGLYIQGNSSSFENGVLIQNNTFNSQSYLPVSLTNVSNTEFSNNSITSSGNSVYIGLRLSSFRGSVKIFNNKINVNGNSLNRGVVLEGNNDFDTVQFYNNFIYTSGTTSAMSLYCYDLQNANIYYNNILNECLDSSGSSTAFYYAYGNYRIMNNNFVHLKNGYAVYRAYVYSILSNNNNLYSSGTKYIYWDGVSYGNLADFSSAELQDTNSVEVDPIFTSSDDLHVSFVGINAKAKPIAGITKDIDGQTRNTSTPDIGADEFNPDNLDVSVLKLLSPNSLYKADTLDVDLILINLGLDTIKKVTAQIKINNDTLTRKIFNRTFASGDTVHVRLGSYIFKKDSVYNFMAWSSLPNGSADQKSSNDTLQINSTTPAMSGVYTIGGTTPDFTTFTAAINALKAKGIIDSVRFRVRSGTYYEQLTIPHINGSANRNSIIFESQSFDSTAVVLEYGSSLYDSNYVVQLNGADGVTFRYMTISATSSSNYNHVFDIRGGAKNNTIYKNIIEGTNTTNSTSDNALIFSGQDTDDNLWIKDNHFKNGDYAMYLYGYSSYGYERNLEVSGNKILNPYFMGIYLYYSDSASILNNYIYADKYYNFYGMQLQYNPNKLKVERNVLDLRQGYYGIYIYNCGNSYKRSLVANNAVYLKNPSNYSYGIYAYYPYYTDFLHNSINIDNPYTSSRSFSIYYGGNNKVYNNIFVNKGTGYAYSFYSSSNSLSNTNDMYSLGTSMGYYNGSNISNLSSWKSTTAMDSNSISIDPIFKSASDLHAKEISLNGKAKYFSTVPLDFEGQIRDTLKPDIGADEFDLPQNDAGIMTLLPFATDSQFVKVAMKNYGGNTITSATIGWTFNNVSQTAVSWSGSVASGDTVHVKLSKKYFKRDTAYDFNLWTTNPNGVTDPTPENDTLEVVDEYPAMNGEYTIGGTTPDFTTFTAAVNAVEKGGIIDSVLFKVRNGTYTEQLEINNISGATHKNSVIFQSETKDSTKVILQFGSAGSSTNYLVWLNGSDGVSFRKMTLHNTSATYRRVFYINNGANYASIENNIIKNNDSTSTSSNSRLVWIDNNMGEDLTFLQNVFFKGSYGIYLNGSSSSFDRNVVIKKNVFSRQTYSPAALYRIDKLKLEDNNLSSVGNNNYYGVQISSLRNASSISGNKIIVSGNNAYYGLYIYDFPSSSTDSLYIYNNFISIKGIQGGFGFYGEYLNKTNFYYNNILNECTDSSGSSSAFYNYSSYIRVFNNNFVHLKNGYAVYNYYGNLVSDFNNLYTNGTKYANRNGSDYFTLNSYRTATGLESKSVEENPSYVSSSDLHASSVALNGKGKVIAYVTKDIDGETRNATKPDIGADEFTPPTLDAGVSKILSPGSLFKADTLDVEVIVSNYGIDTIKSVTVHFKVNNDTLARKIFIRTFPSGDTIHVKLGEYVFKSDSVYNITSWTSLPNGATDQKKSNDTLKVLNSRPAMTGVYTIGGTAPNFPTFKAAVNALKLAGMIDSVRFRVRSGTYTEQISIPQIGGAWSRNSVIFESESFDSNAVVLQYSPTYYDTNYVVQLKGADGITFRYMTVKSNSAGSYSCVFDIRGGAHNNTIYKNIIQNPITNGSNQEQSLILSASDADDYLNIKNNILKNGGYSIYLYGSPSSSPYINERGLEITHNRIQNPFYMGMYIRYNDTVNVSDNYLFMSRYIYSYGIYLQYLRNFKLNNNKVDMPTGYLGIYMYDCGNSFKRSLLSNNSIYLKNSSYYAYGIYMEYTYYTDLIHNSVNINNIYSTSSTALNCYYGSNNNLYNNNLCNSGNGYSIYNYSSSTFTNSNRNNLYTKGSILGYYNGSNYTDLASWKTATTRDTNSVSINPIFKSESNLHAKEVTLNGAAKYFKSVPLDFDGETRDTLTPDIGADEFQLPPNDAGIVQILTPNKPFASDTQMVKVAIKNFGGNKLYVADIGWKFNGVSQTTKSWSDTLNSGDTMHVNLGKKFFHPDSGYSLIAWTSNPNGTNDSIKANDTAKVYNQYPALSGVYTIGGASPDFATFTDAVTAMKRGGIIDSVRFDVRSGTYYEQITIPYIVGANSENDIIFQSEVKDSSKVYLIGSNTSSNNYVVRLDSVNGVTFRHMGLSTIGTYYYNHVFEILEASKNINIYDCNLRGSTNNTTSTSEAIIYLYNSNSSIPSFSNVEIYNNRFTRGEFGIYAYGYSSLGYGKDLDIHHNNFEDQYYMGIDLEYVNNFHINGNAIYHTSISGHGNSFGIQASYCVDGFELTNNTIYNQEYYGVYMYDCDGKYQDTSLFANNFIHCRTNNTVYGLTLYYTDYLNLFNNNIHITSSNASSQSAYIYSTSRTASYNNNFVSTGAGYAINQYGNLTRSDFNNYYTAGSNLGYHNSNTRSNLAAWKSSTGMDSKSISSNPDYVSATDLHVRGTDLDGKGRRHPYIITKDIDGQNRNTTAPDIGADEFDIPAADDAGILSYVEPIAAFAAGSKSVKVIIKNYGSDSLKSATVKWKVNGTLQSNYSWTGALKTGQTQTITIGNFNFVSGKKHDIVVWTTSPNGKNDTTNYNDTAYKYNIYPALDGVYTVGGTSTPDFATLAEANTALKLGGVVDSVWFKIAAGTYPTDITIDAYLGAHPSRPVYFESITGDSSDVILTNAGTSQIIFINGADYLKFRKLTFKPTYYYGMNAIRYDNNSSGLAFENCYFDMNSAYTYYYYNAISLYSSSGKDDSLTVKNCRFDKGIYGVYSYSNSGNEKGINISNNLFNNQIYNSVNIRYADAPKIKYNTFNNSTSADYAISLNYTALDLNISYNKINYTAAGSNGIYIYAHSGTNGAKANIYNNFISINGTNNSERGIYVYSSSYVNLYHNSVNIYGSNTGSYAVYLQSGNNFDIRNNVLANTGGGYAVGYSSSPSIAQSNYNDIYTTGTNIGNINGTNITTFTNWKSSTSKDANSLSLNPTFNSDVDLHTNLSSLDSACLPISIVTDDIDLEARNTSKPDIGADEFQSLPENLGISAFITPVNSCGFDSTFIKVKIFNFGNKPQVGFPVKYRINGGSIISATINDTIKPGKELHYQFVSKVPLSLNTTYLIQAWTDLTAEKFRANDSLKLTFTNYQQPDSIKNMVPADATTGLDFPFTLSWAPSSGATRYDLYVWPFASSRPSTPTVANSTQISQQINSGLTYGDKYNWQVIAKNPICSTPGLVQVFTMKHLPNLFVEEVSAPNTAFSSTSISVSWKIKNSGQGTTAGNWYDAIFLSTDGVLDVTDTYLGAVVNPSALNSNQNYTQSANVTLPNGISGNYYIFIRTDEYNQVIETDNSNNSARDTGKVVVSLTPPPDLIVTGVSRPSTAFSGAAANLTYVVKNNGTGNTRSGGWYDRIYLSTEKAVNGTSYLLKTNYHSSNLKVDSIYSVTSAVTIPNYISGKYFFVVYTDATNSEYEHASESNNTSGSDTIKVILTPPPDLIIRNLTAVDTASNSESILAKYNVINDGGTSTSGNFYDAAFLNPSSTFNSTTAIHLGNVSHSTLASKDTSKVSKNFKIPSSINGTYYLFIFTDYGNAINEVGNEGNNGTSGYKIIIKSPDLRVSRVIVASTDTTGSNTPISWTVKNIGPGGDYHGLRNDSIYISSSATWNRSNSKALGRLRYSATLLKNDTLDKSTTITIPDGFDGNRYFFVVADASKEVYEQGKDTNNYKRSNLMNVTLAPYPDLLPTFQSFPDSAKAGQLIGLSYSVKNQGEANAFPNWKDRYYFSKDSVFNLTKVFTLAENSRTVALDTQASYDKTVYMTLPSSMAKGNYYYFIYTDADKQVYEHFNDSNNIVRSKKIFIDGYPPVDLVVNCPSIKDTLWSGSNYTLSYSVTNKGEAKTAVGAWSDAAYLSTDSILNSGDVLIATININKALDKDSTYSISKAVTIPDGIAGEYYLLVKSDITQQVKDIDTLNNINEVCKTTGGAKKLIVNLTPPPDLRITSWNIPSTGVSGQPMKIKWTVENKGTGATHSGSWMDQFYLSTDYTIDGADYHLGDKRHTGNLAVNGTYNDSNSITIPLDKVGNYIIIIKTDGANVEYEHTNEANNVVSSVTNLTKAPPADLIVSQVTSPDSVLSGKTVDLSWKVKNKGSNPASGYLRDNIYLSLDNKQDASDLLLHSELYYISLAPNSEASNSKTLSVSGVAIGDYYVLVSTDVLNNINESTDTNNTSAAGNLLNVNVPILPIATKTYDTLTNGEKIYYRIEIPADFAGESMLITLKADSIKGNNQIFVRHQNMVSGSEFDFKYRESFKGNQEIIIPELEQGTYYLLTTGTKSGAPNYQPIILFARIMPFEIRKVTPNKGGNTGEVTVLIEGSKFEEGIQYFLIDSLSKGLPVDTGEFSSGYSGIFSASTKSIDPTQAYVTFNLTGQRLGYYDVGALKGDEVVKLKKGFQVVAGTNPDLNITVSRPGNMRTNNIASMNVIFSNSGNTDLVNHKIIITSNAGAPIALSEDDLSNNYTSLEITVQENDGPSGRLRPGGNGSVTIYTKASAALGFTILK